jgi:hypothetical protein
MWYYYSEENSKKPGRQKPVGFFVVFNFGVQVGRNRFTGGANSPIF